MASSEWQLLRDQLEDGFERMSDQNADILVQLRNLNGRVTDAHIRLAVHEQKMAEHAETLRIVRERTHKINNDLQTQERRLLLRDVAIVTATASTVAAIMRWGKSWMGL